MLCNPQLGKWIALTLGVMFLLGAATIVFLRMTPHSAVLIPWRVLLVSGVLLAGAIAGRGWIARNAALLFAMAGAGLLLLLVATAFRFVRMDHHESVLRGRRATELHQIGAAFRQAAIEEFSVPGDSGLLDEPGQVSEVQSEAADSVAAPADVTAAPAETSAIPELPEWASAESVSHRELREWAPRNPVVLVSDEWSSVPESEIQLEAMAARVLQQQLQLNQGSSFKWRPSKDFIHQSGAIQRRFTRQTTLKVGEFAPPMYQTYWEVAVTPQVSNQAQAAWRGALAEFRLLCLGGGAAGLTLLFASIAAGLRFDSATAGRHRRHMFAAAGLVTSMGAALVLHAAR